MTSTQETSSWYSQIETSDEEGIKMLEAIRSNDSTSRTVLEHLGDLCCPREGSTTTIRLYLPHLINLSRNCPYKDLQQHIEEILARLDTSELEDVRLSKPSRFFSADLFPAPSESPCSSCLQTVYSSVGRVNHMDILLSIHPEYYTEYSQSMAHLLHGYGPLSIHERYYVAILGAARYDCDILIRQLEIDFVHAGGNIDWLLHGVSKAPEKYQRLTKFNAYLAHQPWNLNQEIIEELCNEGLEPWSLEELVQAMTILATYHSLSCFIFAFGISDELDVLVHEKLMDPTLDVSCKTPPSTDTESREVFLEETRNTSSELVSILQHKDEIDFDGIEVDGTEGRCAFDLAAELNIEIRHSQAPLKSSKSCEHRFQLMYISEMEEVGEMECDPDLAPPGVPATPILSRSSTENQEDAPSIEPREESLKDHLYSNGNGRSVVPSPLTADTLRSFDEQALNESKRRSMKAGPVTNGPRSNGFMRLDAPPSDLFSPLRELAPPEGHRNVSTGSVVGMTNLPTTSGLKYGQYTNNFSMIYVDFDVHKDLQLHDYDFNWSEGGYPTVQQFYGDMETRLDTQFDRALHMTYNNFGGATADTFHFRDALWHFVLRLYGSNDDSYNYHKLNLFMKPKLKMFVKKFVCFPQSLTYNDVHHRMGINITDAEKIHAGIIVMEAKKQVCMLYGLHAVRMYSSGAWK